jgi:hypothetical protein
VHQLQETLQVETEQQLQYQDLLQLMAEVVVEEQINQ